MDSLGHLEHHMARSKRLQFSLCSFDETGNGGYIFWGIFFQTGNPEKKKKRNRSMKSVVMIENGNPL